MSKQATIYGAYRLILFASLMAISTSLTAATELFRSAFISASNYSLDGQDIIINGSTLTIDGEHHFNSVTLVNSAVLTHSSNPSQPLIINTDQFFIDYSSKIDVTAKGTVPSPQVTGASGGSYGGLGGVYLGTTNPVYGNHKQPMAIGTGGIGDAGVTYGGGAITIKANTLIVDGSINASGQSFTTFWNSQGGGSGGSVYIDVDSFTGTGTINASGGSGFTFYGGGGGGGGRIAIYYNTTSFDLQNNIVNEGGTCKPLFGEQGQPGSIYLEDKSSNVAPSVDAGLSLIADEQSPVTLQASAEDTDGSIVTYSWKQTAGPAVVLTNADTHNPSFIAPAVLVQDSPTVLNFSLTVTDNEGASASDTTSVGIYAVNDLPEVYAGNDVSVNESTTVELAGFATDLDGSVQTVKWEQVSGQPVSLTSTDTLTTAFVAPALKNPETLVLRLSTIDNESGYADDEISITINPVNTAPVAKIIAPETVAENTLINLDGALSYDPDVDGFIVAYNWTQTSGPAVTLSNSSGPGTSFTAPTVYQDTVLGFQLEVKDDENGYANSTVQILVYSVNPDDDSDQMPDLWEIDFFGSLEHNGTEDTDGDGATDLEEFNLSTDPTKEEQPLQPEIVSPDNTEVATLHPELVLQNNDQATEFNIRYHFEVYTDNSMQELVDSTIVDALTWTVNNSLDENQHYFWRARAVGTSLYSEWVSSDFFVNTVNEAPGEFNISYPLDNTWVSTFTPELSVTNSVDPDHDNLTYRFEVYLDGDLNQAPVAAADINQGDNGVTSWIVDVSLFENHWYSWRAIVTDEHGLSTVSHATPMIFINTINEAPSSPVIISPLLDSEIDTLNTELVVANSIDPELQSLSYIFEIDTVNTFDSSNKRESGITSETTSFTGWHVDNLLDNTWYFWRAKASDGYSDSTWVNGQFFVNQFNDAPDSPVPFNPGNDAWVGQLQPTLEVIPVSDIDGDKVSYEFQIYATDKKQQVSHMMSSGVSETHSWQTDTLLESNTYYAWKARAIDEHGLASDWSSLSIFYIDEDGINDAPTIKLKKLKYKNGHNISTHKHEHKINYKNQNKDYKNVEIRWKDRDPDSNAKISLFYDNDRHGNNGVLIIDNINEDPDGRSDRYDWDTSQLADGIYYVYAVINDGANTAIEYTSNFIIVGQVSNQPFIELTFNNHHSNNVRNKHVLIEWNDIDDDSNASIELFYDTDKKGFDGSNIIMNINENNDGDDDKFMWNLSEIANGKYYIYAVISDETSSYRVYAEEPVTVRHSSHGR